MSLESLHRNLQANYVTHPSLHIRDANDAHVVLEAVRLNILPLIKRRLVASERAQLKSGNIFVWEEGEDSEEGGLLRWTEGKRWSQSRMRGDYLFYEEKVETTQDEKDAKAARRARRASDPTAVLPAPTRRKDRPSKPNGFTKQTYSAVVHLPGSPSSRKWHVVAYFSGNDYTRLPVIEDYDYLRRIRVPNGIFFSGKSISARPDHFPYHSDEAATTRDSAPFQPVRLSSRDYRAVPASPISSVSSSSSFPSPTMPHALTLTQPLPPVGDRSQGRVSLPPISSLPSSPRKPPLYHRHTGPATRYAPLCPEDRRALDSFRVVL